MGRKSNRKRERVKEEIAYLRQCPECGTIYEIEDEREIEQAMLDLSLIIVSLTIERKEKFRKCA